MKHIGILENVMINLNEYDGLIAKSRSWIDPTYKRLYSEELERKPYFTILTKYNPVENITNYYIVMLDKLNDKYLCDETSVSKTGVVKVPLDKFWNKLPMSNIKTKTEVLVDLVDKDEHTIVYYLDI